MIRSKAAMAVDTLGDKYCLVGLYNDLQCKTEVEIMEPEVEPMKGAVKAMREKGVKVGTACIKRLLFQFFQLFKRNTCPSHAVLCMLHFMYCSLTQSLVCVRPWRNN